ncbi:MAG TPA: carboxypeptidase-like regulatory domain-containing protein [Bryobacteraceae bacterium]|nr:carboxypeptidase-like regulatory domain-containing protein [Bryobacteraceae bacterium]
MTGKMLLLATILSVVGWGQDKGALPLPGPGNVTLPLDEYNRLVELAGKPPKKSEAPPVPYAIKSVEMKFEVTGESASGTIQLDGEVLGKGVIRVPLVTGMTILDARQKGTELPLEQERGIHTAVLPGPADFSVTLDAGLPLAIEPGRASLNFLAPSAGTVRLTLVIPGEHTSVNINQGLITSRASANGRTTVEATLVPGQQTGVWWATREIAQPTVPRETRFLSDVKTLISVSDAELRLAALADITVVQGDPAQFEIEVPAGFEVTGATGASLESSEVQSGVLVLRVSNAAVRSHQFLVSMVKASSDAKADVPFLSLKGTQRETGEVLVEGEGAMELTAKESGSLKLMDLKEVSPYLRSLARYPLHSAFRYHRQAAEAPGLSLTWVRFPDSNVLAAVAQDAIVTTLVTSAGNTLTEVKLVLRNQAQPFLKVALPAGASIVSADVAGERVKPVQGSDGNRVPLLRSGFRPTDSYTISFVYMDSGAPFAKKGGSALALPKMDVPIGLLQWEVFLPERYKVTDFGGDAFRASLLPPPGQDPAAGEDRPLAAVSTLAGNFDVENLSAGQLAGYVLDPSGAVIPRAHVTVVHVATNAVFRCETDAGGRWLVSGVPSGRLRVKIDSAGFQMLVRQVDYDASRPSRDNFALRVGATTETVEVTASAGALESRQVANLPGMNRSVVATTAAQSRRVDNEAKKSAELADTAASPNVANLQKRVAGVLPIPVDIPRAGASFRFVRPLVIDEETHLTFSYKTK